MDPAEWAIRTLEPCYDVVYSLRQFLEILIGTEAAGKSMSAELDRIFVGVNGDLHQDNDPPSSRQVFNFRSHSWKLSDQKHKISIVYVDDFLDRPIFDEVDALVGGNRLLHVLESGSWFELVDDRSLVQRIGERLDYSITDQSFVFRPRSKLQPSEVKLPIFEYKSAPRKRFKKRSRERSQFIDRKCIMYSRARETVILPMVTLPMSQFAYDHFA